MIGGDYLSEFFTSVVLPWSGILLAIYLVYYAFRYQYSKNPLEKQLYKVYLPMFIMLEPYLYRNIDEVGYNKLNELSIELNLIVDKHYELVSPSVVHWCRLFKRRLAEPEYPKEKLNELYMELCEYIDREFEKTRSKMFLPTRNLYYRINNNQFSSKAQAIAAFLITLIPPLSLLFAMIYISFVIMNWLSNN